MKSLIYFLSSSILLALFFLDDLTDGATTTQKPTTRPTTKKPLSLKPFTSKPSTFQPSFQPSTYLPSIYPTIGPTPSPQPTMIISVSPTIKERSSGVAAGLIIGAILLISMGLVGFAFYRESKVVNKDKLKNTSTSFSPLEHDDAL